MEQIVRVLIDCPDSKGLVYKISKVFYDRDLNIENNREFVDKEQGRFFMRTEVSGRFEKEELREALAKVTPSHSNLQVVEPKKKNIVLFATKESHALGDILVRHEADELDANILAVVSNHNTLKPLVDKFEIPFFYIDSRDISRVEHERKILGILENYSFDYIVLAKYMRILTSDFVSRFQNKILNIHHSFLPAFIGANPYKQAYNRGVKIIGATAHFVTDELDEGPIIAQDVISVNHRFSWRDMQKAGRDVEKIVLSRALDLVLNDRVFVYGNKTIVFK
jgi:formyltetrahydrofolate deformylase